MIRDGNSEEVQLVLGEFAGQFVFMGVIRGSSDEPAGLVKLAVWGGLEELSFLNYSGSGFGVLISKAQGCLI